MKTTTKTAADLAHEQLDAEMTESDREYWRQVGEQEQEREAERRYWDGLAKRKAG